MIHVNDIDLQEVKDEVVVEEQVVTREKPVTVRLHYHRPDGDYSAWSVWMWGTGDCTDNAFTGTDVYVESGVEGYTTK